MVTFGDTVFFLMEKMRLETYPEVFIFVFIWSGKCSFHQGEVVEIKSGNFEKWCLWQPYLPPKFYYIRSIYRITRETIQGSRLELSQL